MYRQSHKVSPELTKQLEMAMNFHKREGEAGLTPTSKRVVSKIGSIQVSPPRKKKSERIAKNKNSLSLLNVTHPKVREAYVKGVKDFHYTGDDADILKAHKKKRSDFNKKFIAQWPEDAVRPTRQRLSTWYTRYVKEGKPIRPHGRPSSTNEEGLESVEKNVAARTRAGDQGRGWTQIRDDCDDAQQQKSLSEGGSAEVTPMSDSTFRRVSTLLLDMGDIKVATPQGTSKVRLHSAASVRNMLCLYSMVAALSEESEVFEHNIDSSCIWNTDVCGFILSDEDQIEFMLTSANEENSGKVVDSITTFQSYKLIASANADGEHPEFVLVHSPKWYKGDGIEEFRLPALGPHNTDVLIWVTNGKWKPIHKKYYLEVLFPSMRRHREEAGKAGERADDDDTGRILWTFDGEATGINAVTTEEVKKECYENNIYPAKLNPSRSHVDQPLDRSSCFRIIHSDVQRKPKWSHQAKEKRKKGITTEKVKGKVKIAIEDFWKEFEKIPCLPRCRRSSNHKQILNQMMRGLPTLLEKAFVKHRIQSGFEKSGICELSFRQMAMQTAGWNELGGDHTEMIKEELSTLKEKALFNCGLTEEDMEKIHVPWDPTCGVTKDRDKFVLNKQRARFIFPPTEIAILHNTKWSRNQAVREKTEKKNADDLVNKKKIRAQTKKRKRAA
mmetsp:Transcript_25253/g.44886  ORF Transcript_25253/g.44886 Transcript_25253/m.44886 type:complete len:670 (+) Transcript_25253:162-2171(+)